VFVPLDPETVTHLRALAGKRLVRLVGRRYPNPPGYFAVRLVSGDGSGTDVSLREENVAPMLDVFCVSARPAAASEMPAAADAAGNEADDLRFADFRVDRVSVLRRGEWIEAVEDDGTTVGRNPMRQSTGRPEEVPPETTSAVVDAGIALLDDRGPAVVLEADLFPLVLQCRYLLRGATPLAGAELLPLDP